MEDPWALGGCPRAYWSGCLNVADASALGATRDWQLVKNPRCPSHNRPMTGQARFIMLFCLQITDMGLSAV